MTEKKRYTNYELLRVLAMVMVVVLHFLSHSDSLLVAGQPGNITQVVGTLLESFCLVAVNVYVLISGYFGVESEFKVGKAVRLLCIIWFYGLLLLLVASLAGIPTQLQELGIYGLVKYLFPIESETYWFATSYFMLYLLSPILNMGAKHMPKKQLQITIGCLLILFCGIKSVSPIVFPVDRYGYDLAWFVCVYLVAAYLRLYGAEWIKKHGLFLYVGSSLVTFFMVTMLWFGVQKWDGLSYYFTVPFHYNFVLCILGALGLFGFFANINIREGKGAAFIRRLGALSFGVYLFHEHIDIRNNWYEYLKQFVNPTGGEGLGFFFWELISCVVILFVVGILIDYVRSILFALAGKGRIWKK